MASAQPHVIQSRQDIINFVNSNPVTSKSWKIILVALGGIFVDAYDFTSLGIGADQLKEQFNLSPAGLGSLTAIMALGALLGATVGGYYTDKFGRNKMFLIDLFFMVFSALGAALATDLVWLFIFRFLMGVGVGLDVPVALSFIAEFSNLKKKGQYVNLWCPLWYVAATVTGLVVLPFYLVGQHEDIWRWSVGFGAVAALIVLILRYRYMDESPMWAAHHLPLKEAVKVLEKTYDIQVTVAKNAKEEPLSRSKKLSYKAIFQGKYRARTFLASIITATQSMQYFAVGFYIPTVDSGSASGRSGLGRALSLLRLSRVMAVAPGDLPDSTERARHRCRQRLARGVGQTPACITGAGPFRRRPSWASPKCRARRCWRP
jgi:MFS family permease